VAASLLLREPLPRHFPLKNVPFLGVNLWRYRELLWYLVVRNLRSQYRQSVLGYAWIMLSPLSQLLVYAFVFSVVLKTPSQGTTPFTLFLFMGLLPWIFFANSLMAAVESISTGGALITKVYFPREILTVAAILTRLVDLGAGLVIFAGLMVYFGQPLGWTVLWFVPILLIQVVFTVGLALPLAAANLFFRDIRFVIGLGIHLWFFITPVVYPVGIVPAGYTWVYELNPMARLIGAYRWALFANVPPPIEGLLIATGMSLVALIVGYYLFKRMEPAFADSV
jgi:ABC-type polysaccharide/polyol phosphate export permease